MNRIMNPFSANLRQPESVYNKQNVTNIYRQLTERTGETDLHRIGETLKTNMPESAKDYASYITLLSAL